MAVEWISQFNPFNSMKILVWREWIEAAIRGEYLPPVAVAIDPCARCQLRCIYCNAYDVRGGVDVMGSEHLNRIADFIAEWGVKSTCIAGGGEPLLNPSIGDFLLRLHSLGIKNSLITNGIALNNELMNVVSETCSWIGFSVDAGSSATYSAVKGTGENTFDRVIANIARMSLMIKSKNSKCTIGFKYLLHPLNAKDIYKAAHFAKEIGVNDFQLRPCGWDNISITDGVERISYDGLYDTINEQIEDARKLESETFHVYAIRHKFDKNYQRKVSFKKCYLISMHPTFAADGNVYMCMDRRGDNKMVLATHYPDPNELFKMWNSDAHRKMMTDVKPQECPRCTFGGYHEIVENVFIDDKMNRYHI